MKKIIVLVVVLSSVIGLFAEFQKPEFHSVIMLDARFFSGENNNNGNYNNANRFQVRKASLAFEGLITDRVEYDLEIGLSGCTSGSGGDQIKLMDVAVMYEFMDDFKFGIKQGHIINGYASLTGCSSRLTLEKPEAVKSFGSCNAFGFVINKYTPIGDIMALEAELAILNGTKGTLNGEGQYNFGLIFDTFIQGLSLLGSYNYTQNIYYDSSYEEYTEDGYRFVAGANYQNNNIWLTAEYYTGEGFVNDDQQMNTWYAQAGYDFRIGWEFLNSVQPYARYEFWDKDVDAKIKNDYKVIETGINFKLTPYTALRCAYRSVDASIKNSQDPNSFIVRLQTVF